jgi:biotin carboxyl carrier protein
MSLLVDGESYDVAIENGSDRLRVSVRDHVFPVEIADERRMRLRAAGLKPGAEGRQTIDAPMPGKIVRVLVAVGDEVTQGQGLVVVEAMKMENELRSPKDGTVVELAAVEGQTVEGGAQLVVVE